MYCWLMYFFFFSSRRRHTRWNCDWSSDVCCSDLAIAHIRGGADKGWGWYLDGKREKKTNTFHDFAASARALIEAKYTGAKRIVAHGGSAGGMLMGAIANRAGELFAGIVAEVPFVDVLNTMLDDT